MKNRQNKKSMLSRLAGFNAVGPCSALLSIMLAGSAAFQSYSSKGAPVSAEMIREPNAVTCYQPADPNSSYASVEKR